MSQSTQVTILSFDTYGIDLNEETSNLFIELFYGLSIISFLLTYLIDPGSLKRRSQDPP